MLPGPCSMFRHLPLGASHVARILLGCGEGANAGAQPEEVDTPLALLLSSQKPALSPGSPSAAGSPGTALACVMGAGLVLEVFPSLGSGSSWAGAVAPPAPPGSLTPCVSARAHVLIGSLPVICLDPLICN